MFYFIIFQGRKQNKYLLLTCMYCSLVMSVSGNMIISLAYFFVTF